jgi:AcrR family transcriptional regulator
MPRTTADPEPAESRPGGEAAWRERAVERSLRAARAKAVSRNERYIQTAVAILAETGRTDFTLQELCERARTSLRTFYQHFSSKDELLLVLVEEVMDDTITQWRKRAEKLEPLAALRFVVEKVHSRSMSARFKDINRALSSFSAYLAETRPESYGQVLSPLYGLLLDIIERGVEKGVVRNDIEPRDLTAILTQTLAGAARANALAPGRQLPSADVLWQFLIAGVGGAPAAPQAQAR